MLLRRRMLTVSASTASTPQLAPNFPERLHRLVVFPVPYLATTIWSAASAFLDERTAAKVQLLSGYARRIDPIPDGLSDFAPAETVAACVAYRTANLGAPGTGTAPVEDDDAYSANEAAAAMAAVPAAEPPAAASSWSSWSYWKKAPAPTPAPAQASPAQTAEADYGLDELALA